MHCRTQMTNTNSCEVTRVYRTWYRDATGTSHNQPTTLQFGTWKKYTYKHDKCTQHHSYLSLTIPSCMQYFDAENQTTDKYLETTNSPEESIVMFRLGRAGEWREESMTYRCTDKKKNEVYSNGIWIPYKTKGIARPPTHALEHFSVYLSEKLNVVW